MTQTPEPPETRRTLHQHRVDTGGRSLVAIHLDEPGQAPDHRHPDYGPAQAYDPGPVPPSAVVHTMTALRRERAEADLAEARRMLRAVGAENDRLRRLAEALVAAVAGGWVLPPECGDFAAELLPTRITAVAEIPEPA